jgi:hypothetical protein
MQRTLGPSFRLTERAFKIPIRFHPAADRGRPCRIGFLARISHHHPAATAHPLGLASSCAPQSCSEPSADIPGRPLGLSSTGR